MKLSCHDWLDWVQCVKKTRQDNYMTDYTSAFYTENDTELLWQIKPSAICDEN